MLTTDVSQAQPGRGVPIYGPFPIHNPQNLTPTYSPEEWARGFVGETTPALTPEEWNEMRGADTSPGFAVSFDGKVLGRRHVIAALALYGQSFGFRQHDVDALHAFADSMVPNRASFMRELAGRIAALLPPADDAAEEI